MNKFVMKSTVMAALATTLLTGVALAGEPTQILTASDRYKSEPDGFGNLIALSGDYALIGIKNNANTIGKVYVFKKNDVGKWEPQQILKASDKDKNFGCSMAISGNYALIGAEDKLGQDIGKVYIFKKNNDGIWLKKQILTKSGEAERSFGGRVFLSGNYALIGGEEKEYVFKRNNNDSWEEQQPIIGEGMLNAGPRALFGDYAFVYSLNGKKGMHVFKKNKDNETWEQQQILTVEKGCDLCRSASLSENYAFIGGHDFSRGTNIKQVYIFKKNDSGIWEQEQILNEVTTDKQFGISVSNSECSAVIGTTEMQQNGRGKVYLYDNDKGGVWKERKILTPSDGQLDNWFGGTVAISGDSVFVGAVNADGMKGKVYVYDIK